MQRLIASVKVCLYCWTEREFARKPAVLMDLKALVAQLRRAVSQDQRHKRSDAGRAD